MESESDAKIRALTELVKKEESGLARFAWRCLAMRGRKPTRQDVEDTAANVRQRKARALAALRKKLFEE